MHNCKTSLLLLLILAWWFFWLCCSQDSKAVLYAAFKAQPFLLHPLGSPHLGCLNSKRFKKKKIKKHHTPFLQCDSLCSSKDSKDCWWHAEFSAHSEKRGKQGDGGASTKVLSGTDLGVFFNKHSLLKYTGKHLQKHLRFFSVNTSVCSIKAPFFKEVKKKSKTNKGIQLFNVGS